MSRVSSALLVVLVLFSVGDAWAQAPPSGETAKVLIAGTGPSPQLPTALGEIAAHLGQKGVAVQELEGTGSYRVHVEKMGTLGAQSLLYLTVDAVMGQIKDKLTVQCYDATGKQLWQEKVSSGMFDFTPEKALNSLIKKMKERLDKRVGREGLPAMK